MTNDQATSAAIAQAHEAKADRLFKAILATIPPSEMPFLFAYLRGGRVGLINADLRTLALRAYEAGYDDGFAEGEATYQEPDRNEGYE